jgi:hypothetical protein
MTTATNTERATLMALRRTADGATSRTRSPFCSEFEVAEAIQAIEAVLSFMAPIWGTSDSLYRVYAKNLADLQGPLNPNHLNRHVSQLGDTTMPTKKIATALVTNSGKQSSGIGAIILAHLAKVGEASTEDLVAVVQAAEKDVERPTIASRLWWLCNKEDRLVGKGKGKAKVWSLPKDRVVEVAAPKEEPAPKSTKSVPAPPKSTVAKKATKKSAKKSGAKKKAA